MIIFIVISTHLRKNLMFNCLFLLVKGLCCAVSANHQIQQVQSSRLCLPIKCIVEIKDCYDHCTAEVTPEPQEIELSGAPATHTMA